MNRMAANFGMLGGLLLIVGGVVAICVSGFDVKYGAAGLLLCATGAALAVWCRKQDPVESDASVQMSGRATQKPDTGSSGKSRQFKEKI